MVLCGDGKWWCSGVVVFVVVVVQCQCSGVVVGVVWWCSCVCCGSCGSGAVLV